MAVCLLGFLQKTAIRIQRRGGVKEWTMIEKRRFQRIRFTAASDLTHNNISYKGQLENISLNGALLSFNDGLIVPQDDECILIVYLKGENIPLRLTVRVIYSNFTMIGVKFESMDAGTRERVNDLVAALSVEPEKLKDELKLLDRESDI
jgi:c-di-GMP-binding flagellar brake protein YcgR